MVMLHCAPRSAFGRIPLEPGALYVRCAARPSAEDRAMLMKQCGAEFVGTFWLVLGGCGSAVLAAGVPNVGIGLAGVALAFGLTVLTMAYAIGHISGCHLNPAVSHWLVGRGPVSAGESWSVHRLAGPGRGVRRRRAVCDGERRRRL